MRLLTYCSSDGERQEGAQEPAAFAPLAEASAGQGLQHIGAGR